MMYGSPSYSMGADEALVEASANAPITKTQALRSKAELKKMKRTLVKWLKYRELRDKGASKEVLAGRRASRFDGEQSLAESMYRLLSEVFDSQNLPSPDLRRDPNAAVKLAKIVINGQLPGEYQSPGAQGFIWLWPIVIVVGAIAFVITSSIRSRAEVEMEKERLACVKEGKCVDSGFWMKVGAVGVIGWLVWSKMGLGERVSGALKKKA